MPSALLAGLKVLMRFPSAVTATCPLDWVKKRTTSPGVKTTFSATSTVAGTETLASMPPPPVECDTDRFRISTMWPASWARSMSTHALFNVRRLTVPVRCTRRGRASRR